MNRTIKTKVVGVTAKNDDGSDRQKIIRKYVEAEETLLLEREPDNPFGKNAIAVHAAPLDEIDHDDKIGYISHELAEELAPLMDSGHRITCMVLNKTGGGVGESFGVNIELTIYTPEEVAEHHRKREEEKTAREASALVLKTAPPSTPISISKKRRILLSVILGTSALFCVCCILLVIISQIQK